MPSSPSDGLHAAQGPLLECARQRPALAGHAGGATCQHEDSPRRRILHGSPPLGACEQAEFWQSSAARLVWPTDSCVSQTGVRLQAFQDVQQCSSQKKALC
mmetsp:Transcript_93907/g.292165  ORF Transcript_93907/g.292165 Transcript_93907/m.292165 type:complete len:101 (+) Transcript_93907:250-552(+)